MKHISHTAFYQCAVGFLFVAVMEPARQRKGNITEKQLANTTQQQIDQMLVLTNLLLLKYIGI